MAWTLFGFPFQVWAMMAVEFTERLGYYGVTVMLITYCTGMLKFSQSEGNAVVQGLYAMTPAAACVSSGLSDGHLGRPRALLIFMTTYAVGLACVAISSFPFMFSDFPEGPTTMSFGIFGAGMILFASGFGGMKVCTNPMMADSVVEVCGDNEVKRDALLSRLFRWVYWVTNCGSLIGMTVAPLLRDVEKRKVVVGSDESTTGYYYGFSVASGACFVGVILFASVFRYFRVNERAPSFVLFRVFGRAVFIRMKFAFGKIRDPEFSQAHKWDLIDYAGYGYTGISADGYGNGADLSSPLTGSKSGYSSPRFVVDAPEKATSVTIGSGAEGDNKDGNHTGEVTGTPVRADGEREEVHQNNLYEEMEVVANDYDLHSICSPGWIRDAKCAADVCKVLSPMPIYWLITNQFSTNMVLQAEATERPASLPPEIFTVVNTVALLVSILVLDRGVFPLIFGQRKPPVRGRVVTGFGVMIFSIAWCGVMQLYIDHHGRYDSNDKYVVNEGEEKIKCWWLFCPYILQGLASALVDTTVVEVAYTMAPVRMKGAVMALYLLASSISGFLGLALSPAMKPQNMALIFFSLGCILAVVATLFGLFHGRTQRAHHELEAEAAHLLRNSSTRVSRGSHPIQRENSSSSHTNNDDK